MSARYETLQTRQIAISARMVLEMSPVPARVVDNEVSRANR
jgi:hypothetical protein